MHLRQRIRQEVRIEENVHLVAFHINIQRLVDLAAFARRFDRQLAAFHIQPDHRRAAVVAAKKRRALDRALERRAVNVKMRRVRLWQRRAIRREFPLDQLARHLHIAAFKKDLVLRHRNMDDSILIHDPDQLLQRAHRDHNVEIIARFVVHLFFHHRQTERVRAHNRHIVAAHLKEQPRKDRAQILLARRKRRLTHQIRQRLLRNAHAVQNLHLRRLWKIIARPADHLRRIAVVVDRHFVLTIIGSIFKKQVRIRQAGNKFAEALAADHRFPFLDHLHRHRALNAQPRVFDRVRRDHRQVAVFRRKVDTAQDRLHTLRRQRTLHNAQAAREIVFDSRKFHGRLLLLL